jgi:hypothetical protein
MRLLLDTVRPGSTYESIERLLDDNAQALAQAAAVLGGAAAGIHPAKAEISPDVITLLNAENEAVLEIRRHSTTPVNEPFRLELLQWKGSTFTVAPLTPRSWLPVMAEALVSMIDFAEHADVLLDLPGDMRKRRLLLGAEDAGVPVTVLASFTSLAGVDL